MRSVSPARFPSQLHALDFLRRSARRFAVDPRVRETALTISRSQAFPRDPTERADALLRWTRANIAFIPDPYGTEVFQSPAATLALGAGDCDDHAALLASMLTSTGIPARLVASGIGGELSHVFPEARLAGRWTAADSTLPRVSLGLLPPHSKFFATPEG